MSNSKQRGMTLVEVMVAAVVLSLIMAALVTGLRTFGNTQKAVAAHAAQVERWREVTAYLRDSLRTAYLPDRDAFQASPQSLIWLAPSPRIPTKEGVIYRRLRLSGNDLVLDFAIPPSNENPTQDAELPWGVAVSSEVLLGDVAHMALQLRLTPQTGWQAPDEQAVPHLPHSINLAITPLERAWPPLIVALDNYKAGS